MINRRLFNFWCCSFLIWSMNGIVMAGEPADQLLSLLQPIKNLSADFEQTSLDKSGKLLQQQNGHFVVQKSGEFVWIVNPPYDQRIISDGKIINVFDPDLEQLTIRSLDPKAQMIPLLLFGHNSQEIIAQYTISRGEEKGSPSQVGFVLKPNQPGSLFDVLRVVFRGAEPVELEIVDSLKQMTRVTFEQVLINRPVDQKIFLFSAPEGVDVIDERY